MMRTKQVKGKGTIVVGSLLGLFGLAVLVAGCQSSAKDHDFSAALNGYFNTHQDCLWSNPVKFPETVNPQNDDQIKEFNALADAGLLDRVSAPKARRAKATAKAGEFKLSDIGHLDWTADIARSGYGNFCYGHAQVNSIQSYSRIKGGSQPQYKVTFRESVPLTAWAQTPPVQKAFPKVAAANSKQTATATVEKSNNGWQVTNVSPAGTNPQQRS